MFVGFDSQNTSHCFPHYPNWNLWVWGISLIGVQGIVRGSVEIRKHCDATILKPPSLFMRRRKPSIVDLFCGCGGFSQGFIDAGYSVELANDIDTNCADTYISNHDKSRITFIEQDLRQITNKKMLKLISKKVDGVIGGPPCQGFSLAGKRDPTDPRSHLVWEFVRIVKAVKPKFVLMENVTGLKSMDQGNTLERIIRNISDMGYNHNEDQIVLNARDFGVPQNRNRVFLLFLDKGLSVAPTLPTGNVLQEELTVWDAIGDLPQLKAGEGQEIQDYTKEPFSEFQRWARNDSEVLFNHVAMKHTQRIIDRFKDTKSGEGIKDVLDKHPPRVREGRKSHKVFSQNHNRIHKDEISPTIPAGFKINFIHPLLDRSLTAREGARIQSFRDNYNFKGHRTRMSWAKGLEQYEQIGNAVPPLLARAIAEHIKNYCL